MIVNKIRIPQDSLIYEYDKENDILDIFIENKGPAVSDELYYGVYSYIDPITETIIGVSIMNYTERNKEYLRDILPFDINFNAADQIANVDDKIVKIVNKKVKKN